MANKPRLEVLKRRSEFQKLKSEGKKLRFNRWLLVNFQENPFGEFRCGWTISRKSAKSVVRNRLKRWCREYFRGHHDLFSATAFDLNLVFLAKNKDFFKNMDRNTFDEALNGMSSRLQRMRARR